ncbi:MAG: MFS transporter [Mycobacteriales bacterium]
MSDHLTARADAEREPSRGGARRWSPWRTVVGFGLVSLTADMVYEGARSVYGPLLASLGASALVVGLVTGAGEAMALLLRLVSGSLADRTRRYWPLTIAGYALTAVCVPLLAVTPFLGSAGLTVAAGLILAERIGKAVRSPAKSALLADAAGQIGMGRGLGVHKALDQIGAFAGPLLVAGLVAASAGALWPGLAALAVPGAVTMALLVATRRRAAEPAGPPAGPRSGSAATPGTGQHRPDTARVTAPGLPAPFLRFAVGSALCTAGLVTFGLISFHLVERHLTPTAGVPVLYAAAMAAGAVAALVTGEAYDRLGPRTLLALPFLVAAVPALAFGGTLGVAALGTLVWGVAVGVQDSTVKALVADLVPRERRATAFGIFAAVQGAGALVGGIATGALYERSPTTLTAVVAAAQVVALLLIAAVRQPRPPARRPPARPDGPGRSP